MDLSIQTQLSSFGVRLRHLRLWRGLTLEELASRSGLSKAFLSRLESGSRQASIAAVLTLSRILDVSLASLFESPLATEPCVITRGAEAEKRSANGLEYTPLSNAGRFFRLQPLRITVSPSRRGTQHYQHLGEEWIYVLSGKLVLSLAGKTYDLNPGDAAHFESRLPHRLIAPGPEETHVLLVASPEPRPDHQPTIVEHRAIPDLTAMSLSTQRRIPAFERSKLTDNPPPAKKPQTSHPKKPRKTL